MFFFLHGQSGWLLRRSITLNNIMNKKTVNHNRPEGTMYTCPMHLEVKQTGPGSCPQCGMALEPKSGAGDESKTELVDMTRRFWICAVLSAPTLLLVMLDHLPSRALSCTKNCPHIARGCDRRRRAII